MHLQIGRTKASNVLLMGIQLSFMGSKKSVFGYLGVMITDAVMMREDKSLRGGIADVAI